MSEMVVLATPELRILLLFSPRQLGEYSENGVGARLLDELQLPMPFLGQAKSFELVSKSSTHGPIPQFLLASLAYLMRPRIARRPQMTELGRHP